MSEYTITEQIFDLINIKLPANSITYTLHSNFIEIEDKEGTKYSVVVSIEK